MIANAFLAVLTLRSVDSCAYIMVTVRMSSGLLRLGLRFMVRLMPVLMVTLIYAHVSVSVRFQFVRVRFEYIYTVASGVRFKPDKPLRPR